MIVEEKVKRKVEAAMEALGYGAKVFDEKRYVDVYKRVYLCCPNCGGIGCYVEATIRIYKDREDVRAFVNGLSVEELEEELEKAESEEEIECLMCQKDFAEWLEIFIEDRS